MTSKYRSLSDYLRKSQQDMLRMRFDEVDKIVDGGLPRAAYDHRPWWANAETNNHARHGWLSAGYETAEVDMDGKELIFIRASEKAETRKRYPAAPRQMDFAQSPPARDLRPERVILAAGGEANVSQILAEIERYIYGEINELELGQLLRKLWPRGR